MVDLWESLPEAFRDPLVLATPFFALFLALEISAAALLERHRHDAAVDTLRPADADIVRPRRGAYSARDAVASISMGAVSMATSAGWHALGLIAYTALYVYVAPWHLSSDRWWAWVLVMIAVDFLFYWTHRISHRVRILWATHQAHHSSEYFNFSTALRQKWNNSAEVIMWLPLPALGVPPAMIFAAFSLNLIYQFVLHTERVGTLWRPVELVLNTPSHHRVHHGRDPEYLDRNYGGILIVWDRVFGSFQPELHRPHYGLTTPVDTHNIVRLQTHEYVAIARDLRAAPGLREQLGYLFGPPGWRPRPAPDQPPAEVVHARGSVRQRSSRSYEGVFRG